jgi:hypothetical protein
VHLKFGGGAGGSARSSGAAAAARAGRPRPGRPVNLHLGGRRRFGHNRGGTSGVTRPQGGWQRGGGIPARAFSQSGAYGRASAFSRAGSALGDGAGGRALRPSRGPRLRGGVMPGGSASGTRAAGVRMGGRPARPVTLRLGSSRRRDGAIGGSVLGRRRRGGLRAGKQHAPRFRGTKGGALSGRRSPASALSGRRAFGRRRPWWRMFGKRSGGFSR